MPSRRRSRQRALQVLFQVDVRKQPVEAAIRAYYDSLYSEEQEDQEAPLPPDPFMEELVKGTCARVEEIDRRIAKYSENWRLERMPAVDRNILRMAVFEMTGGINPPAVVINEALELARRFSGEEAVSFINGVLDAIRREAQEQGSTGGR
ncbi:MAG TPA: transcription antitermination factor NusB [Bryobacteraceae bacterium]|nr:transcription antitermination factor NusB [Bryobacteraceae bacterium]